MSVSTPMEYAGAIPATCRVRRRRITSTTIRPIARSDCAIWRSIQIPYELLFVMAGPRKVEWRVWGDADFIESAREIAVLDILINNDQDEDFAVTPYLFVSTDGTFGALTIPTDSRVILATVERRGR